MLLVLGPISVLLLMPSQGLDETQRKVLEWLVVRVDGELPAKQILVKLLYPKNDGHFLFLQLCILLCRIE